MSQDSGNIEPAHVNVRASRPRSEPRQLRLTNYELFALKFIVTSEEHLDKSSMK